MHRFASDAKIGILFSITLVVYPGVTTKVRKVLLCSPIPGLENNGNNHGGDVIEKQTNETTPHGRCCVEMSKR
jgi:hypothetical protein